MTCLMTGSLLSSASLVLETDFHENAWILSRDLADGFGSKCCALRSDHKWISRVIGDSSAWFD